MMFGDMGAYAILNTYNMSYLPLKFFIVFMSLPTYMKLFQKSIEKTKGTKRRQKYICFRKIRKVLFCKILHFIRVRKVNNFTKISFDQLQAFH